MAKFAGDSQDLESPSRYDLFLCTPDFILGTNSVQVIMMPQVKMRVVLTGSDVKVIAIALIHDMISIRIFRS